MNEEEVLVCPNCGGTDFKVATFKTCATCKKCGKTRYLDNPDFPVSEPPELPEEIEIEIKPRDQKK